MNIAIRVDASREIGIGHYVRCSTLADALQKEGHKICFLYQELPEELIRKLQQAGHQTLSLKQQAQNDTAGQNTECTAVNSQDELAHASWLKTSQHQDAEAATSALAGQKYEWMIVDHYALDHRWETSLLKVVDKIMVIDDLADRVHNCHLLLDQNFTDAADNRYDPLTPQGCPILLGPKYALLMPEYAGLHLKVKPRQEVKQILISYGGADIYNMTGKTIDALLSMDHAQFTVNIVSPLASPFLTDIRQKLAGYENFILHDHLPSLAPLLAETDLAFGAMGATSWERLCLGVPTIAATLAENQVPAASALHNNNLVRWLGHATNIQDNDISDCLNKIMKENILQSWSEHCLSICDGQGVSRVQKHLTLQD